MSNLLKALETNQYKWVRIAYNPIINKFRKKDFARKQKVFSYNGLLILENHYTGFDSRIIDYIEHKNQEYFTISAHPIMLSFKDNRPEAWEHFERFVEHFAKSDKVQFARPKDEIQKFRIV